MNEILNLSINEMPQTEFDCSCGRHHNFSVHDMCIRKGAIEELPKMAAPFKDGKILVVFDNNTYKVAGKIYKAKRRHFFILSSHGAQAFLYWSYLTDLSSS